MMASFFKAPSIPQRGTLIAFCWGNLEFTNYILFGVIVWCFLNTRRKSALPYSLFLLPYYLFSSTTKAQSHKETLSFIISEMTTSPFGGLRGLSSPFGGLRGLTTSLFLIITFLLFIFFATKIHKGDI